jgi:hypothetical protein
MNNQSSPAQLLFPTVPSNYCPEGRWSDILNSFIQLYLNNGTVNIPFLNEVTPQQITELQQNILTIQNQLDAVNYQSGTQIIAASAAASTAATAKSLRVAQLSPSIELSSCGRCQMGGCVICRNDDFATRNGVTEA